MELIYAIFLLRLWHGLILKGSTLICNSCDVSPVPSILPLLITRHMHNRFVRKQFDMCTVGVRCTAWSLSVRFRLAL